MNLMKIDQQLTMTSRELAELTGKEHRNVMRDIRKMFSDINFQKMKS